jgi:amino acid adenylation domain-containing protein
MNKVELLLSELKSKGVTLKVQDLELKISAPKGILTPDLLTEIKSQKEQIISLLLAATRNVGSEKIKRANRNEKIPLSFSQQRMWFLNQLEGEKALYHVSFALKVEGHFNLEKLNYALNEIVKRHETLRTVFPTDNGSPFQKILEEYKCKIEFEDLSEQLKINDEVYINKLLKEKIIAPFNLVEGPVLRTLVYKVSNDIHLLLIVIHGIAADGWSAGILFNELTALYKYDKSEKYPLDDIEIQFADFGIWQKEQLDKKVYEPQLQYWKKQLENIPLSLDFPFDFPRKKVHDFVGKRISFSVDSNITKKLNDILNAAGASPFMLLWGVYAYLLYRYTGQYDILIGTPVANRTKNELEKLIGFFANTLVMRAKINPSLTFLEYLEQIKEVSLDALANQDLPFDQLVEAIDPQRSLAHAPLFQTMFVLQNMPRSIDKKTGVKISGFDIDTNVAHFDITFVVNEFENEIKGFLEINTTLIKQDSADKLLEHYKNILTEIALEPDKKLSEIELITEEEKEIIFNQFNKKLNSGTSNKNVIELYERSVAINAEKESIYFEGRAQSYREFDIKVKQTANYLKEHGVKPGDVVGVLLARSFDLIVSVVAILKCGAAYLPVDPEYPVERIRTILNESKTRFIISNEKSINKLTHIFARNFKVLDKTEFVITKCRDVISDLDNLPLPDRGSVDYSKYSKFIGTGPVTNDISILASRGCPYNCLYCHKIWPKNQLIRSSENIFDEVKKYYDCGIRRFTFLDDIFNLRKDVSGKFFEAAIAKLPGVQFFFPNGLRADILTEEFIDLMVAAGTVDVALALESGSRRIQKLIRKNLNLDKFMTNIQYIAEKHPHVFLELQTMFGFPTETEEEALMTLETIKKVKWIDFPNLHVLKIFPNSEIYKLAIENGVSEEAIRVSSNLPYHALPETLPYSKNFARHFQARYMNEYFLNKERLLHVLPTQFKIFTVAEMVQKYDSFLPYQINSFDDILTYTGVSKEELGDLEFVPDDKYEVKDINERLRKYFPVQNPSVDALRILLLDVSSLFTSTHETMLHHQIEEPIGLMYILSNLRRIFGNKINGKIEKALVDFDSFEEMNKMIAEFKPDIIGFRTLSIYKDFFHKCIAVTKQAFPEVNIIAGGPYATSEYDTMLADSNIDFAVIGEGEATIAEFIRKYIENGKQMPDEKTLGEIEGIAFMPKESRKILKSAGYDRNLIIINNLNGKTIGPDSKSTETGNLAYVLYTSGSTGIPKGVAMGNKGAANLINWHLNDPLLSRPMRTLQFASISFDVSFQEIFSTFASGGALYLIDEDLRRDPYELLLFIDKNKIERLFLPVVALQQLAVAANDKNLYPQSIRQIITAGEQLKINDQIKNMFINLEDCILLNHYGPTESHVVTSYQLEGNPGEWSDVPPIGKPVANTNIFLLDENYKPVPIGLRGEIYIAGESLAEGYYFQPGLTAERFIENKFNGIRLYKTGDAGRYLPDGNIEYLGRADEQVKIRGFRVEPGEIEAVINKITGVQNSAVVLSENNSYGNSLTAFIQYKQDAPERLTDTGIIKAYLENNLPEYMVPAAIVKINEIPVNSNGKINKKLLSHKIITDDNNEPLENINEQEELILSVWKDIINIEHVGINDDFFRAGGHSLSATQVVSRVRKLFNVDIQLKSMFEYPTVRKFSHHISEELQKNNNSVKPLFVRNNSSNNVPVSYNQRYFWDLDKKYPGKNINNIAGAYKITGEFDPEDFIATINKIISRHETLRTTFYEKNNEIFQQVTSNDDALIYEDISGLNENEQQKFIENAKEQICLLPFNLTKETTSRFLLIKKDDNEHILLYAIHHIAFDGWSLGIFINELNAFYSSREIDVKENPVPAIRYTDYSTAQNKMIEQGKYEIQINYWKQNLSGYDFYENHITTTPNLNTETKRANIDLKVTESLQQVCRKKDISMFMLLFAAFAETLCEMKNKSDLIINTYIAGREYAELESLIGCFVNILPLRVTGIENCNSEEKLKKIRQVCLDAYKNQSLPINLILKNLDDINGKEKSIPDTMFVFQNNSVGDLKLGPAKLELLELKHLDIPFALQCSVYTGSSLEVAFTFLKSVYEPDIIGEMINKYKVKLLSYVQLFNQF